MASRRGWWIKMTNIEIRWMIFREIALRTEMRETAHLGVIEVVREIVGGEVMMAETRSIETEVETETGKGGETSIVMMIAMIPVLRERVTSGMEKGVVTTRMTGGEKSDIESNFCSILIYL
jgi:hypothetical protein